jgi:Sec-independent protein translocase protein TatA
MGLPEILIALAVVILVFGIYRFMKVGLQLPPDDPWAH